MVWIGHTRICLIVYIHSDCSKTLLISYEIKIRQRIQFLIVSISIVYCTVEISIGFQIHIFKQYILASLEK